MAKITIKPKKKPLIKIKSKKSVPRDLRKRRKFALK